ncbi:MAG: hypothetical protein MJ078_04715, partial [Clostridia bacterium]|nr:hypothetical protein [Clostridia bacterium]
MMSYEVERNCLIRMPDVSRLRQNRTLESHIRQTYLLCPPGVTERVRERVSNGTAVYTHTIKKRITAVTAEEKEQTVSRQEYDRLLERSDPSRRAIEKDRFVLPYQNHNLEIDIYPVWSRQAVLEIELQSEEESFSLPPVITVLR